MATTKKVTEKAAEVAAKVAEVKKSEPVKKAEEKIVEPVKKVVKKAAAPAKKAADKAKTVAKKAADETKKTVAKVAEKKEAAAKAAVVLQFAGKEINTDEIVKAAKKAYAESNKAAVKNITVYVKPEDNAAYYVVNGDVTGKIDL